MHWKRIIHSLLTLVLIAFLIWYYLPENALIRKYDACSIYANSSGKTCTCSSKFGPGTPTTFHSNLSISRQTQSNYPTVKYNFTG